jgi:hypothetical protein
MFTIRICFHLAQGAKASAAMAAILDIAAKTPMKINPK